MSTIRFPFVNPVDLLKYSMFGVAGGYNYGAGTYDKASMFYQHGKVRTSANCFALSFLDMFGLVVGCVIWCVLAGLGFI